MSKYITKRVLVSLGTLIVILFVLFLMLDKMPGSPFNDEKLTEAQKALAEGEVPVGCVIADADKGAYGFVHALFVEAPLRRQGLGTYLLREAEKLAKESDAPMVLTTAGDWNVGFFQKNGYLLRGELKDVPKGHDCYELYKMI